MKSIQSEPKTTRKNKIILFFISFKNYLIINFIQDSISGLTIKLCIYLKQIAMKLNSIHILFVTSLILFTYSQSIVDFTYSQLEQRQVKNTPQTSSLSIKPDRLIIQGFSFPDACSLAGKLEEKKIEDLADESIYDYDTLIETLKQDFIQLLKISEKIKRKKANIQELGQMSGGGRFANMTVVQDKDLDGLKSQEQRLSQIDNQVKKQSQQLEDLVRDSPLHSDNSEFTLNSINFEIESLKLKIDYLRSLRRSSNDAEAARSKDQYDKYFIEINDKFTEEVSLVSDLELILRGYSEVGSIKAAIQHLRGKIQINNIMIEEKQACAKQRDDIKNFQKNDHEIKSLMVNLRLKKKDKSNINNKYCEGVAAKLLDRVKKVLLSYHYTFECAQGLEQIREQKSRNSNQLNRLDQRLSQIQNDSKAENYRKKFENIRNFIKSKKDELSKFSMPGYYHDVGELDRLIDKAETDLEDANQRKKRLIVPTRKDVDYRRIQELVSSIKKLKGTYCLEYEKYDTKSHDLWKQIQKYEADYQYIEKIKGIYTDEIQELKQLEQSFQILRSKIMSSLQ